MWQVVTVTGEHSVRISFDASISIFSSQVLQLPNLWGAFLTLYLLSLTAFEFLEGRDCVFSM